MAYAAHQSQFINSSAKFKPFSKYDFVESFVAATKDETIKAEEKIKAAIIADAIEETQAVLLENLATKEDLKTEIKILEISLKKELQANFMKLAVLMTGLFTLLPLATDFIRHLFKL